MEGWAVLELMGHRKLAGQVSVVQIGGHAFFRIDVPDPGAHGSTQFYSPAAVYCLTPTTEEVARGYAARVQPRPVERWELPQLANVARAAGAHRCRVCGANEDQQSDWVASDLCLACADAGRDGADGDTDPKGDDEDEQVPF